MRLKQYFEKYPNASIARLAVYTGLKYDTLLNQLKKPTNDPSGKNWEQLERKLISKGIDWDTIDWEELSSIRTTNNTKGRGPHGKFLDADINQYSAGDTLYIKKTTEQMYTILATTETHIVVLPQGETKPYVWSKATLKVFGATKKPR